MRTIIISLTLIITIFGIKVNAQLNKAFYQTFSNATIGTVSSSNSWTYSGTWNGILVNNHTNKKLSPEEISVPWANMSTFASIVQDANLDKYLKFNTDSNHTARPLFTVSDTNADMVYEFKFYIPSYNGDPKLINRFMVDDNTNLLWRFSLYAKDPTYGYCLLNNSPTIPSSTTVFPNATNLTPDTWYYIRIVVLGSTVPYDNNEKVNIFLGTTLDNLGSIYKGPAISALYNTTMPNFKIDTNSANSGISIDNVLFYTVNLATANATLTIDSGKATPYKGDVIKGSFTYSPNDVGNDVESTWTLWSADDALITTNKKALLTGSVSGSNSNLFEYTLNNYDLGKYLSLEISGKSTLNNLPYKTAIATFTEKVSVWNTPYESNTSTPILIQPINDFNLTDIAIDLQWWKVGAIKQYEIEASQFSDFTNSVIINYDSDTINYVGTDVIQLHYMPLTLWNVGKWYWRVRTVDGSLKGEWSPTESFIINNLHPKMPIANKNDANNPMFVFEGWVITDFEKYKNIFPEDIKANCALTGSFRTEARWNGKKSFMEWIQPAVDNNLSYYFFQGLGEIPLSVIEWSFQYNPNVKGVTIAEGFWSLSNAKLNYPREYFNRLAVLCAKYGKQLIFADGDFSNFSWQWVLNNTQKVSYPEYDGSTLTEISNAITEYSDYIVLQHKTNIFYSGLASESALQGAWLSNKVGTLGYMPELWYWADWFKKLNQFQDGTENTVGSSNFRRMPGTFWNQMMLNGIMQGASVISLTGQFNLPYINQYNEVDLNDYSAVFFGYDQNGDVKTTNTYNNKIIPFIRSVLDKHIIPSKEEVINTTKIAIDQGSTLWQPKKNTYFDLPSGKYRVYIYKSVNASNDTNAKIDIIYDGGIATTYLDYSTGVSGWVDLGSYDFTNGSTQYIQNTLNTTSKYARADAIKLVKDNSEYVFDYGDSGYKEPIGVWGTDSTTIGYNGTTTRRSNTLGANVKWIPRKDKFFALPTGTYKVYIYKTTDPKNDPNAKIDIIHSDGKTTIYIDYTTGTNGWVDLGSYNFTNSSEGYVKNTQNTADANIRADAVKFVQGTTEYIYDYGQVGYKEISGSWNTDGLASGYNSTTTRYSASSGACVTWVPNDDYWQHSYGPYDKLYRNIYGFKDINWFLRGHKYELIPNNARYYRIPLLPTNYQVSSSIKVIKLEDMQNDENVVNTFNSAYPQIYTGDANVTRVGDTISIMSSSENEDIVQAYNDFPINVGNIKSISGSIQPHSYIMAKILNSKDLWLQTDCEYPDRNITISFLCDDEPIVSISKPDALISKSWDSISNKLILNISYSFGFVEIEVKASGVVNFVFENSIGQGIQTISQATDGKIYCNFEIITAQNQEMLAFITLYDKPNMKFIDVKVTEVNLTQNTPKRIRLDYSIPQTGSYLLKIYFWNKNLNPYSNAYIIQ